MRRDDGMWISSYILFLYSNYTSVGNDKKQSSYPKHGIYLYNVIKFQPIF